MSDKRWEYCRVSVVTIREGSGEITEQIEISRYKNVENRTEHGGQGIVTVLNELGAKGWELFDPSGPFWLKRKARLKPAVPFRPGVDSL